MLLYDKKSERVIEPLHVQKLHKKTVISKNVFKPSRSNNPHELNFLNSIFDVISQIVHFK